jgi:colicin import membrane protein
MDYYAMNNKESYKFPVIFSVTLHLFIFVLLFLHFTPKMKMASDNVSVVKAIAINENQLPSQNKVSPNLLSESIPHKSIRQIEQLALKQSVIPEKPKVKPKPVPEMEPEPMPQSKPVPERRVKPVPKLKVKPLPKLKPKSVPKVDPAPVLEVESDRPKVRIPVPVQERQEGGSEQQEEELVQVKVDGQRKDAKEADVLEDKEVELSRKVDVEATQLSREADAEATELSQKVSDSHKAEGQSGEIDKYKQMIIQTISRKWLISDTENKELACLLLVHLAPGGIVMNVELLKESGDLNLDRSATNAVMKASPLPVPENAELFDNFRTLRLTFRPQGILSE